MSGTVIVVGAGIFGSCVAHQLAKQGASVTLVDQAPPGHARATSSSHTRVLRCGHGSERWYTEWAWRSRSRWLELGDEVGQSLFHETGVAWFARRDDGWEAASQTAMRSLGIPCERLELAEAARLWPALGVEELAWVLLEPASGHLMARRAVRAISGHAVDELGVRLLLGRAEPAGEGVLLDGRRLEADHVVWAAGPWLARLFGTELVPLSVVRRELFMFAADPGWASLSVPAWLDYDASIYGIGDVEGRGFKVAPDEGEEPFDPDTGRRVATIQGEADARAYLAKRFPTLADAPLVAAETCQYELTPDTRFIIARHPEHPSVILLGGGSGHGFKHAPVVAEYVAELLGDPACEPDAQFGLGPRQDGPSLRTAAPPATVPA